MNAAHLGFTAVPHIPVSWGEILDKITILEVKQQKIVGAAAQANIRNELAMLLRIAGPMLAAREEIMVCVAKLRTINVMLWEIESRIRRKDEAAQFDEEFIRLARQVYKTNDERATVKRQINELTDSVICEEKDYRT